MSWNWLNIYVLVHIKSDDVHTVRLIYLDGKSDIYILCENRSEIISVDTVGTHHSLNSVSLMCNLIAVAIEQDSHWFA